MNRARSVDRTIEERLRDDAAYRRLLLAEAAELLLAGDGDTAIGLVRALVKAVGENTRLAERAGLSEMEFEALLAGEAACPADLAFRLIAALQTITGIHLTVHAAA